MMGILQVGAHILAIPWLRAPKYARHKVHPACKIDYLAQKLKANAGHSHRFFCTFSGSSNATQAHTAKMSHAMFMIHPPMVICTQKTTAKLPAGP